MNSRAINAEKDPIRYRRPCWILRIAIETTLKQKPSQLQKSNTRTHSITDLNPISRKIQNSKITEIKNENSKFQIKRTLFSDLVLSFLKTAFLSVKLSEAIEMRLSEK